MHHYIDIHLRPDPEFAQHQLMAALFAKLHRWLAQTQSQRIAVSFPGYSESPATLGPILRLLGPVGELARLMEHDWLQGMRDHTDVHGMAVVPAEAVQRTLRRVQVKSSAERLRRRQMRRHNLSPEEALQRAPDSCAETLKLPYLRMSSASTGQQFKFFIRLGAPCPEAGGEFNAYGLSSTATVPWF